MNASLTNSKLSILVIFLSACTFFLSSQASFAASATWSANPTSGDWNDAANWMPMTVPNGPNDIASFQTSNFHGISVSTQVNAINFNAGADSFTIIGGLTISGAGIVNNSGLAQRFYAPRVYSSPTFSNSASAGTNTFFYGSPQFHGTSTAASGTFSNYPHETDTTSFYDSSTGESAIFNEQASFYNQSTAGSAVFNAGATFTDNSAAMNATFIGGTISFSANSTGDFARVQGANLDISSHAALGVAVGSIEGGGSISMGNNTLTVGTNNASTTFSGVISGYSSLIKTGGGTLTLSNSSNSNSYFTTVINSGVLRVSADLALGASPQNFGYVSVTSGAALILDSGATNNYIGNRNSLLLVADSTVNLNFSGNPDRLRSLIVDGVAMPPGIYGGPASGAPNQLPQFTGTGTILATTKAVSRKIHGAAGAFDIDLPLAGPTGIECRSGGASRDYEIVLTFYNNVTFGQVTVISGTGMIANATGNGTNSVVVDLTGVANAQTIKVAIFDLNDGTETTNLVVPMGVLVGDVNHNGTVNASDVSQVKTQLGPVTGANFRADVTPNGAINASDILQVKLQSGTFLP